MRCDLMIASFSRDQDAKFKGLRLHDSLVSYDQREKFKRMQSYDKSLVVRSGEESSKASMA